MPVNEARETTFFYPPSPEDSKAAGGGDETVQYMSEIGQKILFSSLLQ